MISEKGSSVLWRNPGTFSMINQASLVLFGFGSIFFLVRVVTPSEIGIWILFTSVGGILETVRNGFIRNPFISLLVAAEDKEHSRIIQSSLLLHVLLTTLIVITLVVAAKPLSEFWFAEKLEDLFYIYAVNSILLIPYLHFEYLLHSKLNFIAIFIINLARLSIVFIYILCYYISGNSPTLTELAIVQIFSTVVATLISFQFIDRGVHRFQLGIWDRKFIDQLFHLGKYTFGTNVSSMLIKNTDSWIIGRLVSPSGVAMYNPALRISNIIEVPTIAVANVVFPQVGSKMKESGIDGIQAVYYRSVGLIIAVMLPVVIVIYFLADLIILVLFGKEYLGAVPILKVTILYSILVPFSRQFGVFMDALQMPKLNFYLSLFVAVINVVLNFIFIKNYGVIGAAYSTLILYCIIFLICQFVLYYKLRINTWLVVKGIVTWYVFGWRFVRGWITSGKK